MTDQVNLDFKLHDAQLDVMLDPARFIVLVAGRRFGKSYLARVRATVSALDSSNVKRLPVWIVAPTQPQAKQIYWRELMNSLHALIEGVNVNEGLITLKTGVQIGVKGSDRPDTLRGVGLWDVILDEYATMKPFVWEEILRPALSDGPGRALFIGTPEGRNHFYDVFTYAKHSGDPEWSAYQFDSTSNIFLPKGEIEAARRSLPSSSFRKEYGASFDAAGSGRIKPEWFKYEEAEPEVGDKLVTVDLAGFGTTAGGKGTARRDRTVIVTARVWDAPPDRDKEGRPTGTYDMQEWWVKDIQYGRWAIKDTVDRIVGTLISEKPIAWGVERGALYNAVVPLILDEARRRGEPLASPVPLSHENRTKAERILWALEGRFEHGKIKFARGPWNAETEDELVQFPSKLVNDDIPDALAYLEQLARNRTFGVEFEGLDEPYWAPLDQQAGF